jgi:hypothetical protein
MCYCAFSNAATSENEFDLLRCRFYDSTVRENQNEDKGVNKSRNISLEEQSSRT